jgi:hypothetical protein
MSDHRGVVSDLPHEQYLRAAGVSHSMLKLLREKSPAHLKAWMDGHDEPETEAKRIGTLTHRALLLPDTMKDAFHVAPPGLDFRTKDGKAWKLEHADRPIIAADELKTIEGMVASVHRHPVAKRLLSNAAFEQSIFVEDSHGTMRKLRPDILPRGGNILPDLKTCESAQRDDFEKVSARYGYWTQAQYYLAGCKLAGMEFETFAMIAVEKDPPYAVAIHAVDPVDIEEGAARNNAALTTYRRCLETDTWPGYPEDISYISLPTWMRRNAA